MNCLVDTSVVSQTAKPVPDPAIMRWWSQHAPGELAISAVTVHELRYGIERMPVGKRRDLLENWLSHSVLTTFASRIPPVDATVADRCGRLLAQAHAAGRNMDVADALIAATAEVHGLKIATLNHKHFAPLGSRLVDFQTA